MTRLQALAWLKAEFADAIADLGWTYANAADEGNLSTVIDNALRALGATEAQLAAYDASQDEVADYLLLLNYYALRLIVRALGLRVDVKAGDPDTQKWGSQASKAYKALLDAAAQEVSDLLKPGFETGALTLDIYEPTPLY